MIFNKLIPELSVSDFKKSLEFYTKVLNFKIEYSREKFAFLSLEGSQLMIEEINNNWNTGKLERPFGRGINFQIEVKNIKPFLENIKKNKYRIFREPEEHQYKVRDKIIRCKEFLVQDLDGYLLRFSEDMK